MKKCANKTEKNEKSDINTQSYMCLLFCVLCLLCVFSFCSNKIGLLLVSMASVPDSSSDVAILGVLEIIKLRCVQEACCPVGDRLNSMSGVEPVDPSMPSVEPVDGPPVDKRAFRSTFFGPLEGRMRKGVLGRSTCHIGSPSRQTVVFSVK